MPRAGRQTNRGAVDLWPLFTTKLVCAENILEAPAILGTSTPATTQENTTKVSILT